MLGNPVLYCIAAIVPFLVFAGFAAVLVFIKRNPKIDKKNLKRYKTALIILKVLIGFMIAIVAALIILLIYTVAKTPEPFEWRASL